MADKQSPDTFWVAALKVGGIAVVAFFVMYQIYDHYLTLGNLVKLTPEQSFIVGLVMIAGVFVLAVLALLFWYLDNEGARKTKVDLAKIDITNVGARGIEIGIPEGSTFQRTVIGIAEAKQSTAGFKNFTTAELSVKLRSQSLSASDVPTILKRLGDLALGTIPDYTVEVEDGRFTLTALEETKK